uniref:Uncharacterized protein n=1 Tax=Kalanchoe fedtschenkoi TaxID=63787 RepID=A0A7N0T9C5_KALFE
MGKRYFQGRNAFQNGNFRGRGNFSSSGGGRAYNRNEHGHGDDFSNHSSGGPLFNGGGYHRGRGKFSQSNGQYHN